MRWVLNIELIVDKALHERSKRNLLNIVCTVDKRRKFMGQLVLIMSICKTILG